MDPLVQYGEIIESALRAYVAIAYQKANIEGNVIDAERKNFLLMIAG